MKIDPKAIDALERAIAERVENGLAGYVILRVDAAPARPIRWKIIDGERVVDAGVAENAT